MKLSFIALTCLLLTACASSVDVDYRPGYNFSQLKTFQVQDKPVNASKDTRVNNPFMQQRTVAALKAAFTSKGLSLTQANADVVIKYHLDVKQEVESDGSGVFFGFGTSTYNSAFGMTYGVGGPSVASVDDLVLTIDVLDRQNALLWRGSLGRRLYAGSTPETNNKMIQELVAEILKRYPPR